MSELARFVQRNAVWVIGVWVVLAATLNFLVPRLEPMVASKDQPFLPSHSAAELAVRRSAAAFAQHPTDNVGFLVLERDSGLTDDDRAFYGRLINSLHADFHHVVGIEDWWRSPLTAGAGLSDDQSAVTAGVRLAGMLGTTQSRESIGSVRAAVTTARVPAGLSVYFSGPGPALVDEFATIDEQVVNVVGTAFVALFLLLLLTYRSLTAALIPLVSVGLSLVMTKVTVELLAQYDVIGVSQFAVVLGAVVAIGSGAASAILLLKGYNERSREGQNSGDALAGLYTRAIPVLSVSNASLMLILGSLSFSRISMFAHTGPACVVAVLMMWMAELSLTPALISLAGRFNLAKPPRRLSENVWRRIGVNVLRWPGTVLISTAVFMFVLAIPLHDLRFQWNVVASAAPGAESTRGYRVVEQHFGQNRLVPDVLTVETDHDIRDATGLMEVEQITGALMTIPGVREVQSASRMNGQVPRQLTLTVPAVHLGDRIQAVADQLNARPETLGDLDDSLNEMVGELDSMHDGLQQGPSGLGQVGVSARQLQISTKKLRSSIDHFADAFSTLPGALSEIPDCGSSPVCSNVANLVRWSHVVVDSAAKLATGVAVLADGVSIATRGLSEVSVPISFDFSGFADQVDKARQGTTGFRDLVSTYAQIRDLPTYLHDLATMFRGTPGAGLNAALAALTDPDSRPVLNYYYASNGLATRFYIYGDGDEWAAEGGQRLHAYETAVSGATRDGVVKTTAIEYTGIASVIHSLQHIEGQDAIALGGFALIVLLGSSFLLLRSPVAAFLMFLAVLATYASTLGASIWIWQYLFQHWLHWSVLPISFLVLTAVGSGYNLYMARRIRYDLHAGPNVGILRALDATGGSLTIAGVIFALTLFAMAAASSVISVAQIGVTVGIGLLLNAFVVRSFLLPATLVLLGDWFWWPRPFVLAEPLPANDLR